MQMFSKVKNMNLLLGAEYEKALWSVVVKVTCELFSGNNFKRVRAHIYCGIPYKYTNCNLVSHAKDAIKC